MFANRKAPTQQPAAGGTRPPMFGGFGGTKPREQGSFIQPGTYIVEVEKMIGILSNKPGTKGHEKFIAEFTILETVVAFPADREGGKKFEASNRPGERVSFIQNVTKFEDMALGNIKGLMLAIGQTAQPDLKDGDISPEEWDTALAEATAPPHTKCAGVRLICQAIKWETSKGNHITAVSFRPYLPEASPETPA